MKAEPQYQAECGVLPLWTWTNVGYLCFDVTSLAWWLSTGRPRGFQHAPACFPTSCPRLPGCSAPCCSLVFRSRLVFSLKTLPRGRRLRQVPPVLVLNGPYKTERLGTSRLFFDLAPRRITSKA